MSKDWLSKDLWRAHVSWLTQEWIGKTQDGRRAFKAVEWIDNLQRAKYNSLIFYLKHHDGNCTFRTKHDAKSRGGMLRLAGIKVTINEERIGKVKKAYVVDAGGKLVQTEMTRDGAWLQIGVAELGVHETLVLQH